MDPRERLDLTSEEKSDQNRILEQVFDGADELEHRLLQLNMRTSEWFVHSPDSKLTAEGGKYLFRNGDVTFDFITAPDFTTLIWLSNVPVYLRPGSDASDFDSFKNFIFGKLPAKMHGIEEDDDFTRDYHKDSQIKIALKGEEGFPNVYGISTMNELFDFQKAYTDNPERIRSVVVEGEPNFEDSLPGKFVFGLTFPDHSTAYANISLSLPLDIPGMRGWNRDVLEWVLSNHKYSPGLLDREESARTLGKEINQRAVELFHLVNNS